MYFFIYIGFCEARAHDNWFRAQVEHALTEADDPATVWLSNEEVRAHSAARRAKWSKCVEQQSAGNA